MENRIQILLITNTYPTPHRPGDTPNIRDQVEDLKKLGVSVDVYYIDGMRKLNYLLSALRILALNFMPRKYDLIHAFYGHSGALAKLQRKYPVIVTFLGSDLLSKRDGWIGKYAAHKADGVIVMTDEMKIASGRVDARIIPFDPDTTTFTPSPMSEARADLGLPPDKKLILFPWNPARPEKQFDLAQEAVEILKKQLEIELLAVFDQPRAVIAKYMNACDAMILTSSHEGAPLAVREAMACKLPIISVDVGDVRKILETHNGGYIVENDPQKIAAKIISALSEPNTFFNLPPIASDSRSAAEKVLEIYHQMLGGLRLC